MGGKSHALKAAIPPLPPLLPADSEDSQLSLRLKEYLKPEDIAQVMAAYRFSAAAHEGQFRKSGEPYISHPVTVACILAELHLDAPSLMAALLHDVMEDTAITKQQIAEQFGKTIAELVDGVSKLDKIEFQTATHAQAENFRKMLLAMSQDVRVILVKLADRLHNMRTLDVMAPEKRRRIGRETLEIYAPIANRLGLNAIYQELEDLSLQNIHPMRFQVLNKAVKAARGNRKEVVSKILEAIKQRLAEMHIEAEITGREKHLYSIYQKIAEKTGTFSLVFDIYGFRTVFFLTQIVLEHSDSLLRIVKFCAQLSTHVVEFRAVHNQSVWDLINPVLHIGHPLRGQWVGAQEGRRSSV